MKLFLALAIIGLAGSALAAPSLEGSLLNTLKVKKTADIFISFKNADVDNVRSQAVAKARGLSRGARIQSMYNALSIHANATQANVLSMLEKQRSSTMTIRPFWITNQIAVKGADMSLINQLLSFGEISEITEARVGRLVDPVSSTPLPENYVHAGEQWGVLDIEAEKVWARGDSGSGVTVGSIDTGCRSTHVALRDAYRTPNGWFDPVEDDVTPTDLHGHGTHTIGTMLGNTNGIGVAPEAKFISCKGMDRYGFGSDADFIACGQFMVCPTDANGNNPRCDLAPVAVGNSWGYIGNFGFFDKVIDAWIDADIAPVFAAGNEGQGCSTLRAPGSAPRSITIGATDETDAMAYFSSAGPNQLGDVKPTVSAPGTNTISCGISSDTSYASMSGTSMATPHTVGVIALLHNKKPGLTVAELQKVLQDGSQLTSVKTGKTCGGIKDDARPNNHLGHGKINALRSFNLL